MLLSDLFEVYGVVKPGSLSSTQMEYAKNYIGRLSSDNVLLVCSSTNHLKIGNPKGTIKHILNLVKRKLSYKHNFVGRSTTEVWLNYLYITNKIEAFIRVLRKLAKTFSHTRILETDRKCIHKPWIILKLFKELLSKQILSLAYSVPEKEKIASPITFDRYIEQSNCDYNCWFSMPIESWNLGYSFWRRWC